MEDPYQTLEDFLLDDHFINWVQHPNEASDRFWSEWQTAHPLRRPLLEQARLIVLAAQRESTELSPEEIHQMWQHLQKRHRTTTQRRRPFPMWAAACLVGLLLSGAGWFVWYTSLRSITHQTAYSEVKTVVLPDHSTVLLNANSTLSYPVDFDDHPNRVVTLQGEAYFTVQHTSDHQTFTVHTDNLAVEVLGTEFNVQHRRGTTRVTLSSGKVKLNTPEEEIVQVDDIIMLPGEQATLTAEGFHVATVEAKDVIAWKENKLIYDNVPLREVAQNIEDLYGRSVIIEDDSINELKLSGTLPHDDINTLLILLKEALSIQATEEGNEIRLNKIK